MATDYVDAGQAVGNSTLSGIVGEAPPVAEGLTYERILNARSEPQNWLTYYGAYDGQRYSTLDQINKDTVRRSHSRSSTPNSTSSCKKGAVEWQLTTSTQGRQSTTRL